MGYSRDYTFYPPEMKEAIVRVFEEERDIEFEAPTESRAVAIRGQFYAYFRALRRAEMQLHQNSPEYQEVYDLARKGSQLSVYVEGKKVILTLKSNTPEMNELRRVLAEGVDKK